MNEIRRDAPEWRDASAVTLADVGAIAVVISLFAFALGAVLTVAVLTVATLASCCS